MNIIVAYQKKDRGIGFNGEMPWHLPEDLKYFKEKTTHSSSESESNILIMGRKTWDSLPFKPLPNRRNIVLSKKTINNVEVYHDIDECINTLQKEVISKIFIIGGSAIYKLFFKYATHLHITYIDIKLDDLDTFFPINHSLIKKKFIQTMKNQISEKANYTTWVKK